MLQKKGKIASFKLQRVSGFLICYGLTNVKSYWGFDKNRITTLIINEEKEVIVPKGLTRSNLYLFYTPGADHLSDELILNVSDRPYDGDKGEILSIWYGEDFWNLNEYDNSGEICVNVYAKYQYE